MANKKRMEELKREQEKKEKQTRYIQISGIGVVLLVVILAFWYFMPKSSKPAAQANVADIGNSTACDVFADIPVAQKYTQPPMKIDTSKQYFATVKMAKGGEFIMQLYPDKAPITVNSFVFLGCKGFFNGVTFHRVLEGFMAQTGDPTGTGLSGPGYQFVNEKNDLTFDKAGVVAMANAGPDTNGSQFFIMFNKYGLTEDSYTIFGQVVSGMDVVNGITRRDPQTNPTFTGDAMDTVTITVK